MAARSKGPREDILNAKQPPAKSEVSAKSVPEDMTAAETEAWVDGDSSRARAALEVENKRDHPRSTVVSSLERLAADDTGKGVLTGEA
jgi:hypothetical protein